VLIHAGANGIPQQREHAFKLLQFFAAFWTLANMVKLLGICRRIHEAFGKVLV